MKENEVIRGIDELDEEDAVLKELMGEQFQDMTGAKPVAGHAKNCTESAARGDKNTAEQGCTAEKKGKGAFRHSEPAFSTFDGTPRWLWACTKNVLLYAGIGLLVFTWQQQGLMAECVAYPSTVVMAVLAGISIGKFAKR